MQAQKPQFRTDLIAKPVTVGGTRLFEVHCPSTGRTLRFSEDGYSIAYLLNGARSLSEVALLVRKQRGISLTVEKLRALTEHLDLLGCLSRETNSDPNLTVPYNAVLTVAIPVLGDGGLDEALATVVLNAESFDEYYTIVPDDDFVVAEPVKCRSGGAKEPATRSKPKSLPPPVPVAAINSTGTTTHLPSLPPLPAWPPLENSIRLAAAAAQVQASKERVETPFPALQSAQQFPIGRVRARAKPASLVGAQSLWLATGFFAAALVWASWALFRLG